MGERCVGLKTTALRSGSDRNELESGLANVERPEEPCKLNTEKRGLPRAVPGALNARSTCGVVTASMPAIASGLVLSELLRLRLLALLDESESGFVFPFSNREGGSSDVHGDKPFSCRDVGVLNRLRCQILSESKLMSEKMFGFVALSMKIRRNCDPS